MTMSMSIGFNRHRHGHTEGNAIDLTGHHVRTLLCSHNDHFSAYVFLLSLFYMDISLQQLITNIVLFLE